MSKLVSGQGGNASAVWSPAACERLWTCLAFDKNIGVAHEGSTVLAIQRGTLPCRLVTVCSRMVRG